MCFTFKEHLKKFNKFLWCSNIVYHTKITTAKIIRITIFINTIKGITSFSLFLFSFTKRIETVVYLSKLKSDEHVKVEVDISEFEPTERRKLGTYEEIKKYILDKYGFKVPTQLNTNRSKTNQEYQAISETSVIL